MKFITAAYGAPYTKWVKALAKSFHESNPDEELIVYTDADFTDRFKALTEVRIDKSLTRDILGKWPPNDNFRLKTVYMTAHTAKSYPGETVCWIDADTLVFSDLKSRFDASKINAATRGPSPEGNRLRNPGGGLRLRETEYVISGVYCVPNDFAQELAAIAEERQGWKDRGEGVVAQGILNHLVHRHPEELRRLDEVYPQEVWGLLDGAHPNETNPSMRRVVFEDGTLRSGNRTFPIFQWVSKSLKNQIRTGFPVFKDESARKLFQSFYG